MNKKDRLTGQRDNMTETKKKVPKKKGQDTPPPKERTRETNPIYQGPYTLKEYLEDAKAGQFTTHGRMDFITRIMTLPPEERKRLDYIDEQAKASYEGPTSWDVGDIGDIPEYFTGNLTGLDYYRTFYELSDPEAIAKRLGQIKAMANYMESKNLIFTEIREAVNERHPGYIETVNKWATQIEKTRLGVTRESEELREVLVNMSDAALCTTPEDTDLDAEIDAYIRESTERIRAKTIVLETLTALSYEDIAKDEDFSKALEPLESKLSEDVYNQDFEAFRLAHPGESYRDAIIRILRGMIWGILNYGGDIESTFNDPNVLMLEIGNAVNFAMSQQRMLKDNLEDYKAYINGESAADQVESVGQESTPEETKTTMEMAKIHPFQKPKKDMIPHDYFSQKIGTPDITQAYLDDFTRLEGQFTYRRERKDAHGKVTKPRIRNKITITNLEGELTAEDMALTSAIASLQRERNPEGYENKDLSAPLYVSENELLKYYYGLEGKEPTPEQKAWLSNWIEKKATHRVEIDFKETLKEYPELGVILSRNFPDGQAHAGIIGDYDLPSRYEYSRNPRKTKRINKDGTITEDYDYTKWYYFPRYPITTYYSQVLNQSSLLDSSFRETPTLREGDRDDNGRIILNPRVINRLDEMKKDGLNLWKIKDGVRYISLNKSPDFPKMKWVILSKIEGLTSDPQSRIRRGGALTLDLDDLSNRIWGKCSSSSDRDHRRYMMTYLIYLMNNPKSLVYDIHPIKKGKRQAQSVRIELNPEELPKGTEA